MTRMGHNEMLAELEQSGCRHLTSALIAKGPTCVAKRRNGESPTGQRGVQESRGGAEGVRPDLLLQPRRWPDHEVDAGGIAGIGHLGRSHDRLSIANPCPSSRVQRPEWGAARGTTTPKSGVMVEPGPIARGTRSILL